MLFNRRIGIKLKITLAFSTVFILLSFALNFYSYSRIRNMIISDYNRYLMIRANSLLDKTEVNPVIIPLPDKNASIRVFYHSGKEKHLVFQSPGLIASVKTPLRTGITDTLGLRVAYVISSNDENPAELMLAVSNASLTQNLDFLFTLLFICSVISVVIAGLVSYLLASFLLLPIQRLTEAAKTITTNKLRDLIPVSNTNDELQELTETINSMLQRIDESLQQQQNFFASASHELKTPLSILRAELEVQLKKDTISKDNKTLLLSQLEEINRLQQVVQEFLVISQLKSGGMSINRENIDLAALIIKGFNRMLPVFKQKGQTTAIEFDQETSDFFVSVDEDKIRIVLTNLLDNAIKYGLEGSVVTCKVRTSEDGKYMRAEIVNAIDKESIQTEKLSEAFYRADILQKGAGLGLWLCKEIIKAHNGKMVTLSENYQFRVSVALPLETLT